MIVARIGNKDYTDLQSAIDNAESGATISLYRDVDLNVSKISNDNNRAVTINKSLTLKGNKHRLYNDSEFGTASVKLVAVTDLKEGDKVVLEDLTIESSTYAGYLKGLQIQDSKKAEVDLVNVSILLPHYYAVYLIDTDTLTLNIDGGKLQGYTTVYNKDSNVVLNARDTHLISVNPETSGDSNSFAAVIVSEYYYYDAGKKYENNTMTFTDCVFDVSKSYPKSNVKQWIADLRSPCNNTLILNGCKLSPAENSTYIKVCEDSTYKGNEVPENEKKTNRVIIDDKNVTGTDIAEWYIDAE